MVREGAQVIRLGPLPLPVSLLRRASWVGISRQGCIEFGCFDKTTLKILLLVFLLFSLREGEGVIAAV